MKERPMLFNGEMVRAMLKRLKTQDRRVIKPQPVFEKSGWSFEYRKGCYRFLEYTHPIQQRAEHNIDEFCPYGKVGDRFWVRESFRVNRWYTGGIGGLEPVETQYKIDGFLSDRNCIPSSHWDKPTSKVSTKYHSARFMPKWAARIWREITGIRVERVRDISEADSKHEGCEKEDVCCRDLAGLVYGGNQWGTIALYKAGFKTLWDSINAKRGDGWHKNRFVWVLTFKEI